MKIKDKANLVATIERFVAAGESKLMIIWFNSNKDIDGAFHTLEKIDGCVQIKTGQLVCWQRFFYNGRIVSTADYPEERDGNHLLIPESFDENTRYIFYYHTDYSQLTAENFASMMSLVTDTDKPLIILGDSRLKFPVFSSDAIMELEYENEHTYDKSIAVEVTLNGVFSVDVVMTAEDVDKLMALHDQARTTVLNGLDEEEMSITFDRWLEEQNEKLYEKVRVALQESISEYDSSELFVKGFMPSSKRML